MKIKMFIKAIKECNIFTFLKYNYFAKTVIRKAGAYLYPYRGSIIQIDPNAKLELNGTLLFNAGKYKGSRAESYLILDKNSKMIIDGNSRINYGSTVHVNRDGLLEIGSMTSNVGINFQVMSRVHIGKDCMFGRNSTVFDSSFHPTGYSLNTMEVNTEEVMIGNHVWVGAYAFIMQGSVIGDGSIIGSKAYVRGKISPASTVLADIDEPVSSDMMWARNTSNDAINEAKGYYSLAENDVSIIKEAVEKYSDRVVTSLSSVIDYIDFKRETDIAASGKLDSLGMLKAVTALNNEFSIVIPYYEIKPVNFQNIDVIASLIWKVKNDRLKKKEIYKTDSLEIDENDEFIVPDKSLPKVSFVEQIYNYKNTNPDKVAIVSEGKEYTYATLFDFIHGYSTYLNSLGLNRGDMILSKSNQSINYIVTYFAAHLAGLEITTVEKNTSVESLYNMAGIVNAKAISTKVEEFDRNKDYIYINSFDVLNHVNNKSDELVFPKETDMADILFTTGTTGTSKGIELTHKAAVCGAENMASGAHMARHTVLICPNPLSHSNAIKQLAATMISGGTFIVLDGITDLSALFNALNYHSKKVSIVLPPSGIRTIFQLAKDDFASFADRLEYLMAATAPLPEPDRETLRQMFPNSRLYNHYGCSESSTISIYDFNKYKELKNCVGIPTPNTNVMFVDDNRNVIKSSKDNMGLLAVSGGTVMVGYYKDPKQTAEVLVDGVVYTKDVGYIDENGFVFITGRNDDVINVGGLKVAPTEVESTAMGLDCIADCICIGVPDEVSGQALKLLIVPATGVKIDKTYISTYLSEKLENYKIPHQFEEVDHIERTYNGKLNRKYYKS